MQPKFPLNSTKNSADNTPYAATEIHLFNIENLATFSIETRAEIWLHSLTEIGRASCRERV